MHLLQYFEKLSLKPKNAKELKGLILDLAIRGRLTEEWRKENPDVEPASDLLEKIKEEKLRLIKEKKIRKEKALSSISAIEFQFNLPSKWEWSYVRNLGYTQTGNTPAKKHPEYYGTFIPFLGPANISNTSMEYPESGLSIIGLEKGRFIPEGSLMMVCIGGSIGKCNVTTKDVSCNQQINSLTPIFCPSTFLKTFAQSPYFQSEVKSDSYGLATPMISKGKWEMIVIPVPPLAEQKAIVKIVNQLMTEVDELEAQTKTRVQLRHDFIKSSLRQLTTADSSSEWKKLQPQFTSFFDTVESVDKLKEAILQLAVQGKLTKQWRKDNPDMEPASVLLERIKEEKARLIKEKKIKKEKVLPEIRDDEIPFELPERWEISTLNQIAFSTEAGKSPKCLDRPATENEWGVIKTTSVQKLYFNEEENKAFPQGFVTGSQSEIKDLDLLITRAGPFNRTGIVTVVDKPRKKLLLSDKTIRINLSKDLLSSQYLAIALSSGYSHQILQELKSGMAKSQVNISQDKLKSVGLLIPPHEEQKAIVKIVHRLLDYCNDIISEIENRNAINRDFLKSSIKEVMAST